MTLQTKSLLRAIIFVVLSVCAEFCLYDLTQCVVLNLLNTRRVLWSHSEQLTRQKMLSNPNHSGLGLGGGNQVEKCR